MSTPGLTWTFATSFLTSFQCTTSDLEARIHASQSQTQMQTNPQDELQAFALELAKLTKSLADATGSLPSYDQRQCELQLKTLGQKLEDLRASAAPKPKFAFKHKATTPSPSSASSLTPQELPTPPANIVPSSIMPSTSSSTNITLTSHSNRYLALESLPNLLSAGHSDLTITNLNGCIVNLLPIAARDTSSGEHQMSISALHIRDVTNTLLLLPIIQGSVILHNLRRCVVIVGCHQFRMHTSQSIDVYLSILSHPIIEHSSAVRFAPYPASLSASAPTSDTKYSSVQDFSHIRLTQSPNWSIIPAGARRDGWLGLGLKEDIDVRKVVDELLPATS